MSLPPHNEFIVKYKVFVLRSTEILVKLKVIEVRPKTLGGLLPLIRLVECAKPGKLWPLEGHL